MPETRKAETKQLFFRCMLFTFIWGIIAHGYCYFNLIFSHDSLLVYQNDVLWQISIGRFLHPVYFLLRGHIYAPALVGVLSLTFIGTAVFLVCTLLNARGLKTVILYSGIMTVNASVSLLNATYLMDADMYALSLVFAVTSVYVCRNRRCWYVSSLIMVLSLGLYQAYFQVAVFLFMILALIDILRKKDTKQVVFEGLRAIASLLIGLILYYIVLSVLLKTMHIELSGEYNGLTEVGKFGSVMDIAKRIIRTYVFTAEFFVKPGAIFGGRFMVLINCVIIALTAFFIISLIYRRKIRGGALFVLIALAAVMPFGMNVIYFIADGAHNLMEYSLYLAYILAFEIFRLWIETRVPAQPELSLRTAGIAVLPCALAVFLFCSTVYSNQVYLKKDLEYRATQQTMNRVIYRMEDTDGYELGVTPVAVIGTFEYSPLRVTREGFPAVGIGLKSEFAVTYPDTFSNYFRYIMDYPINLIKADACEALAETEEIKQMPLFPAKGSCRMIDGVMVVKLGEI